MSIFVPAKDWFRGPEGSERTWIGMAIVWCIIMFIMMPYWHFKGKQNSTGEAYSVNPNEYLSRVEKFKNSNKVGEEKGITIVEPAPGSEVYLLARMWQWDPILKLKEGQSYRVHISSTDLNHGFSLQPVNMNFQVVPGYDHVLTLTPTKKGDYQIICNEFCGIGHHLMTGKIIVE